MKKSADPKWIQAIDQGLGAFLYLYPSEFRKEYGPMIRQAMRDRCREVVKGQRSMFRVLALELIPDIVLGAAKEQMSSNFGQLSKRHYVALSLLVTLSFVGLFRESVSTKVFDQASVANSKVEDVTRKHRWENQKGKLEEFARWLVDKDLSPKSNAMAAYLYQSLHIQSHGTGMGKESEQTPCEYQRKADELIKEVLTQRPDAMVLAIALRACNSQGGCDREKILNRLVDYDGNNSFVWQINLRWAVKERNNIGERYALKRIAVSNRNVNYDKNVRNELLSYAEEYSPSDAELAKGLFYLDIRNDMTRTSFAIQNSICGRLEPTTQDVELLQDCVLAARALSESSDFAITARSANVILYRLSQDEVERSKSLERIRDSYWWQAAYYEGYSPGVDQSWERHLEKWMRKSGSIAEIQEYLRERGKPLTAPPDFDIADTLKRDFDIDISDADRSFELKVASP